MCNGCIIKRGGSRQNRATCGGRMICCLKYLMVKLLNVLGSWWCFLDECGVGYLLCDYGGVSCDFCDLCWDYSGFISV